MNKSNMCRRTPAFVLLCSILLLVIASPFHPVLADEYTITPPKRVWVTPLPEGRSLSIGWESNGTNADAFAIYQILESDEPVQLGEVSCEVSEFIVEDLIPYKVYRFVIKSLDERRVAIGPPSPEAVGWPLPEPSQESPRDPPLLHPIATRVNERSIIVSGVAMMPGTIIEVERIYSEQWDQCNRTVESSSITGWFSVIIDLVEGCNLIHARVADPEYGTGIWTTVVQVVLDIIPPVFCIEVQDGEVYEVGKGVVIQMIPSDGCDDIATVRWECSLSSEVVFEDDGDTFAFIPTKAGPHNISVEVIDVAGNMATDTVAITVTPINDAPRLINLPKHIKIPEGRSKAIDMCCWVEDHDDPVQNLTWKVSCGEDGLFATSIDNAMLTIIPPEGRNGEDTLYVRVEDPYGKYDEGMVMVTIDVEGSSGAELKSGMIMAVLVVFGVLMSYVAIRAAWLDRDDEQTEPEESPFYIKSTYLIHMDGRLIKAIHSVDEGTMDPDMVCCMFTAIQDFVMNSFDNRASLENLSFGEDNLTITRGKNVYLATVSCGILSRQYLDEAKRRVKRLEAEFSGVIEEWDGIYSRLDGIEELLEPLHSDYGYRSLDDVRQIFEPRLFTATPSIDFNHGLVIYSVELHNNTDEIIIDPCLDVIWDRDVLHLERIEPEDSRTEGRFRLDDIGSGERKVLRLYFDPQVCLESFIKASMAYMDIRGQLETFALENTLADINCPIFFTVENANTAMIRKELDEELIHTDTKVYRYALVLHDEDVFKEVKRTIASYNVKFLMEYVNDDPFLAEAWYYGETKIKGSKVIIKATVNEEDSTVEFLVAASMEMVITGLLAELGHIFLKAMDERYTHGYNLERVVKRHTDNRYDVEDRKGIVRELFESAMDKKDVHLVIEMPVDDNEISLQE